MAELLRMPGVAAGATEAVLGDWVALEGTAFSAGDVLATVETDKALVDVEAETAGVMLRTLVPAGAMVEIGTPVALLGAPGEAPADLDAELAALGVAVGAAGEVAHVVPERRDVPADPSSGAPAAPPVPVPEPAASTTNGTSAAGPTTNGRAPEERAGAVATPGGRRVFASPLARRLAAEAGLTLETLDGTGPRNRVLKRDVQRAVAAREQADTAPVEGSRDARSAHSSTTGAHSSTGETPRSAAGEDVPHSRLRRATAARLQQSKQEAPHFYLRATVRVDRLLDLRAELVADLPEGATRVSVNDLVVKAVALAHRAVPEMNVTWGEDAVHHPAGVDVAVAVATERGLVTPVVRDADTLGLSALATTVRDLAGRAREGRLRQTELEGGTISVTNLGMHGVEEFAAIINPPHAAILAVGAVTEEPVVDDGAVVPGRVLRVVLSVDHRPVDGVVAARWLAALTGLLEHPLRILAS